MDFLQVRRKDTDEPEIPSYVLISMSLQGKCCHPIDQRLNAKILCYHTPSFPMELFPARLLPYAI